MLITSLQAKWCCMGVAIKHEREIFLFSLALIAIAPKTKKCATYTDRTFLHLTSLE